MPNDPTTNEDEMPNNEKTFVAPLEQFVIRISSFVIRHFL